MLEPQQQGARALAAKPAMAHQELQWRLALGQTDVLEACPLIDAGRDQHDTSKRLVGACHLGVEQSRAFERPLHQGRRQGKAGPGQK